MEKESQRGEYSSEENEQFKNLEEWTVKGLQENLSSHEEKIKEVQERLEFLKRGKAEIEAEIERRKQEG